MQHMLINAFLKTYHIFSLSLNRKENCSSFFLYFTDSQIGSGINLEVGNNNNNYNDIDERNDGQVENSDQQIGGGGGGGGGRGGDRVNDDSDRPVIIFNSRFRHYRRFNLTGREICVNFRIPPENFPIYDWLEQGLQEVYNNLKVSLSDNDYIGIEVFSSKFKKGSVWLSFRPFRNFKLEDLWSLLESVAQSDRDFELGDTLVITSSIVRVPEGRGGIRLTTETVYKKSLLQLRNKDNLCLPRSICVALAHAKRGQIRSGDLQKMYEKIIRPRKFQKDCALQLLIDSGVSIPECGSGLAEIQSLQTYLAQDGISLIVYSFTNFGSGQDPIFDGQTQVQGVFGSIKYILRIMYYENSRHFNPILNIKAVAGTGNYCTACNKSIGRVNNHRCTKKCIMCLQAPRCNENVPTLQCTTCLRDFFGKECMKNHLKQHSFCKNRTVCNSIFLCKICTKVVRSTAEKNHECDVSFCKLCNKWLKTNHLCYMQRIKPSRGREKILYIFFDFESQQCESVSGDETKSFHKVNLCVAQQVCRACENDEDLSQFCSKCGIREHVYHENPVKQLVDLALLPRRSFTKTILIAHNFSSYDGQFVLKYLVEEAKLREMPRIILNGCKIILLEVPRVKFLDSLLYFYQPLSSLPRTYGLERGELTKGTFPHKFNRPENVTYCGKLPPLWTYSPETMTEEERAKFLSWYTERKNSGIEFNFKEELEKYCRQDVKILRLACMKFRKNIIDAADFCPFHEATTLASTCMKIFRKKFLVDNTIGIIPVNGYRLADTQSEGGLRWLAWQEQLLGCKIQSAARGREVRVRGNILPDGFIEPSENDTHIGTCLFYHGCWYHGCPRCFKTNRDKPICSKTGETMDDRYTRTLRVSKKVVQNNYRLIECWECDFSQEYAANEQIRECIDKNDLIKYGVLHPRDSFYGGRCENFLKMYESKNNTIVKYSDVKSLYPFINKYGVYPVHHGKIYCGPTECKEFVGTNFENINKLQGLIFCEILPPRNLYIPLLPVKMHGKLMFPLCRTCCEDMNEGPCTHENESDRVLRGTWVSLEILESLKIGYVMKNIFEIWQYNVVQYDPKTRTGGLFHKYIDTFFAAKTQASGYPQGCETEAERDEYIKNFERCEGILLDKNKIEFNPGLRAQNKLLLNSQWGKFGEREDQSTTEVVRDVKRLQDLLTNSMYEVLSVLPVNDEVLYVRFKTNKEARMSKPTCNVVIASYTTAQARLKLYSYMKILGQRTIYVDTDSIIYTISPGEVDLPTGPLLGDLTNELESYGANAFIKLIVIAAPKLYGYIISKEDGTFHTVCKMKGIRLNYQNSQTVNFESLKSLVTGEKNTLELNYCSIRSDPFHSIMNVPETKTCKVVCTKRRYLGLNSSLPYGYKENLN